MKIGTGDLRSFLEELDALRQATSEAAATKRSRWATRVVSVLARITSVLRSKARWFARVTSLVAVALLINALVLALADRAYAPYRVGAYHVGAGPR